MPLHRRRVYDNAAGSARSLGVIEQHETTDASSEILLGFVLGAIEFFLLQNTEECFTDRIVIPAGEGANKLQGIIAKSDLFMQIQRD